MISGRLRLPMSLNERFAILREKKEKALVLFVTAGDPPLAELPAILEALQEGGADIIEIGLPFSDPIADGPIIQASSQRALDAGVTPSQVLDLLATLSPRVPLVAMGYYNTLLRQGLPAAAANLRRAHIGATIITDLTPEESDPWVAAARAEGIDNIFLAAPTSTDARLDEVCRRATGFIYAVSRTGVTGSGQEVPLEVQSLVQRVRSRTDLPICVGFGISKPEHVRMVCEVADGAVIGSWMVDLIAREWNGGKGRDSLVAQIRELKRATQAA